MQHHVDAIERDGYTVIERAIAPEAADALAAELERLERELGVQNGRTSFQGVHSRRVYNLVGRSPLFRELCVNSQILPLVDALLGPDALLTVVVSLNLGPGQSRQILHSDDGIYPVARPHPAMDLQALWALSDFTAANGATHFVPGSHRFDTMPDPRRHYDTRQAVMPKGSVLVYHGSLWHGGGANTTASARRIGVAVQYCAGYLRPQENYFLQIPPQQVASYPPRLQQLLGYSMYRKLLGHVDEREPSVVLGQDQPKELIFDLLDRAP